MKYFFTFFVLTMTLVAGVIKTPLLSVDHNAGTATIKVNIIDAGVSGFIVHRFTNQNSAILHEATVLSYNPSTKIAKLALSEFTQLRQNSLPTLELNAKVGDIAILAFGYSRAIMIAPTEEIYYKVTKATNRIQWVHPDVFATTLAFNSHPTPLKEDFKEISDTAAVGLLFFYLDQKLLTVDAKSLGIINITDAPIIQTGEQVPFYSRVKEISTSWFKFFDAGNEELDSYAPYYYDLLLEHNKNNAEFLELANKSKARS